MADLFLRYLRFLLFNPKSMNQLSEFPAPLAPTAVGGYGFLNPP